MQMESKRFMALAMTLLVVVAFATPLANASTVDGTGSNRTVTFYDQFKDTNTTVVVPTVLNNGTDNSFAFTVIDESGSWGSNYTFNITIYDGNATWWNGTVDIVGVPNADTTGYINFTAYTFSVVDDANITITMQWSNWTSTNDDVWYGTVDIVDEGTYAIRVTTMEVLISAMGFGMVILLIGKVLTSIEFGGEKKPTKKE